MTQEWVEVRGPSVDEAVQAGLDELSIESREQAEIEVIQEPKRKWYGAIAQDAVVRIKAKPKPRRRRRGGRKRKSADSGAGRTDGGSGGSGSRDRDGRGGEGQRRGGRPQGESKGGEGRGGRGDGRRREPRRGGESGRRGGQSSGGGPDKGRGSRDTRERKPAPRREGGNVATEEATDTAPPKPDPADQATVVGEFLEGLLQAFGLEGDVATRVEEGIIFAEVTGEQTEALVGTKGAIMQAVLELTRTVVQRKTFGSARLRLDIAGYGARRREALEIYARRLAEQVRTDGEEVMLEPMNPADRKVVHNAVTEIEGVRTFSEGEEPRRSVVIGPAPGHGVAATAAADAAVDEGDEGGDGGDEPAGDDRTDGAGADMETDGADATDDDAANEVAADEAADEESSGA